MSGQLPSPSASAGAPGAAALTADSPAAADAADPEPDTAYSDASTGLLVRKRIVWLLILLITALASASVIAAFEQTLAAAVALAFFIPVVTGSGGNTGTQSATLIIRALATGDVSPGDWARVFGKELLVGAVLGACLAAAVYGIGLAWPGARPIAPVVAATMVALVIWQISAWRGCC